MKRLYPAILVFLTVLSFHCQKEINYISLPGGSDPLTPGPDLLVATVQGNILDESGQPAGGVKVRVGNKIVYTDNRGYFRIVNAALDKRAALVTAEKSGYFKAYRSFSATDAANHVVIKMIKRELSGTISNTGGEVSFGNGAKLLLPRSAVIKEAGGNYTGDIKVYSAYIDPSASDIDTRVPGSFMADNSNKERVTLASFGMMAVELESASGEKLQIAGGRQATLTMPIPTSLQPSAPASISLWYLDEKTGIWKEEGKAVRVDNSYIGEVKHFSFWNCDIGVPVVLLSMTLKSGEGLPLIHSRVRISTTTGMYTAAYSYTDSMGRVSGQVPLNQGLRIEVLAECNEVIFSKNIGPFNSMTDLGVVTVSATGNSLFTIKGRIVNCNGAAVNDGTVQIFIDNTAAYISSDQNGEFSFIYLKCNVSLFGDAIIVTGIDNTAQQIGSSGTYTLTTPVTNVGDVVACGISAEQFITYTVDGLEYFLSSTNPGDSLIAYCSLAPDSSSYKTFIWGNPHSWPQRFDMTFNSQQITAGNYAVKSLTVNQYPGVTLITPFQVNITEFPPNNLGFFKGSFTGQFRDSLNQDPVHSISVNFKVRRL